MSRLLQDLSYGSHSARRAAKVDSPGGAAV